MSQQTVMPLKADSKTPAYAWVVLSAIYVATLASPLNQFKVPPLMSILMETFELDYGNAGLLMSIFSIMGFVLAIPAGFILGRIGIKMTGMIAVGATVIGSGMGAVAGSSGMLFTGRFIEGAGMGLIMVAAPSAISLWFPAKKRALPMGLWASSVGIGYIVSLNLAPVLVASYNWQSVWWAGTIIAAAAFVLFGLLFRLPKPGEMPEAPAPPSAGSGIMKEKTVSLGKAMANLNLWLLGISFGCFNLVILALNSFYPDFLVTVRQYPLSRASLVTSLVMLLAILFGPLGGHLSDRIGSRKLLIVAPFLFIAVLFLFPFTGTGWMIPASMIAFGVFAGPIAPVILAAVPEVMPSLQLAGIGMGVAALCQNLGMFAGPTLFGQLLEITNWSTAGYLMIPITLVGVAAAWMAKIR